MYIAVISDICMIIKLMSKITLAIMCVLYLSGSEKVPKYFAEHKMCAKTACILTIIGFVSVLIDAV